MVNKDTIDQYFYEEAIMYREMVISSLNEQLNFLIDQKLKIGNLEQLAAAMDYAEFREDILAEYGLINEAAKRKYDLPEAAQNIKRSWMAKLKVRVKQFFDSSYYGIFSREIQIDIVHSLADIYAAEQPYKDLGTITNDAEMQYKRGEKEAAIKEVIKYVDRWAIHIFLIDYVLQTGKISVVSGIPITCIDEKNITAKDYGQLGREVGR